MNISSVSVRIKKKKSVRIIERGRVFVSSDVK